MAVKEGREELMEFGDSEGLNFMLLEGGKLKYPSTCK